MNQRIFSILAMLTSFLLIYSGYAVAGMMLYDDFSSAYIDGSKWRQRAYIKEIVDGQYVSKLGNRSPGMDAELAPGSFRNHLQFKNSDSINSIECEITIVDTKLDSAPDSASFAQIPGYFYNINETGGVTGDIFANIAIGDRGNGGLEAWWTVQQVINEDYTKSTIESRTVIGPGTLQYNTPYIVKIAYDKNQNQFSFEANGQSDSFTGPTWKRASQANFKSLTTVINAINGLNNGYVFAKFDNIYVNNQTSIYDDFSSNLIDPTKWEDDEWVRESSNGYLRLNSIGYGSTQSANTVLTEGDAPYLEAKVFIDSASQLSDGAWGIGRLQGYYYNDSRGSGSGQSYNQYEGDVFAQILLRYNSDGTLSANAYVDRSNASDESDYTSLFAHDFSVPISLDTYYTLSIKLQGKKLIFQCDGEMAEYNIGTPMYPAYGEHRLLRSRVYLDPGEMGYMKVRFDDVYIETKSKFNPSTTFLLLSE